MIQILLRQPVIWGPIFLISTVAIAARVPLDLLFLAVSGLYLSVLWKMRGFVYALSLLFIASIFRHLFLSEHHLFELGLEISLACACFISALSAEQGASFIEHLSSQVETRKAAVLNLEEEMVKIQENSQELQIAFQEKVATLRKELEDLQSDHSSILILNEVLRKKGAKELQINEKLTAEGIDLQRVVSQLKGELQEARADLSRLKNSEEIAIQNRELMNELNMARSEKEQTHLINETLARLYAKESFKAKEADQEAASLQIALRNVSLPLEEKLKAAHKEMEILKGEFERASLETHRANEELVASQEIQRERNFLKERLEVAVEELSLAQKQKFDPKVIGELGKAEEKIGELSKIEPLYKQLKKQFEEKNQVLHQVRTELFKVDTELQKLKREQESFQLSAVPKEVEEELEELMLQVEVLEEENGQLISQIEKKK